MRAGAVDSGLRSVRRARDTHLCFDSVHGHWTTLRLRSDSTRSRPSSYQWLLGSESSLGMRQRSWRRAGGPENMRSPGFEVLPEFTFTILPCLRWGEGHHSYLSLCLFVDQEMTTCLEYDFNDGQMTLLILCMWSIDLAVIEKRACSWTNDRLKSLPLVICPP
jgi:hypothetical protein